MTRLSEERRAEVLEKMAAEEQRECDRLEARVDAPLSRQLRQAAADEHQIAANALAQAAAEIRKG